MYNCKITGTIIHDEYDQVDEVFNPAEMPHVIIRRDLTLPFVPRKEIEIHVDDFLFYADDVAWQHEDQLFEIGFTIYIDGETLEEFVAPFEGTEWKYEFKP